MKGLFIKIKENIKITKRSSKFNPFVVATIGRPLIFSSDFSGRAMHAPTKSKLISSDFLPNPSVSCADSSPKREPRDFCRLFLASLLREVASAVCAEVGGSSSLMKPYSLSQLR